MKNRLPFPILHEDRDVVVIVKPAGMLTSRTRAKETNTAEAWLNDYVRKGQAKSRARVWLVHRLDRETSGVMMFAKSEAVADWFRARWNEVTEKIYLARVEGELVEEQGVFEGWLQEDADGYRVRSVPAPTAAVGASRDSRKQPKFARTEWRRLSSGGGTTLVEVSLKSGRKNQIRVQFSEAGHPVVGDVKYGGRKARRLYLHALRLTFCHPHTGRTMSFESPTEGDAPPARAPAGPATGGAKEMVREVYPADKPYRDVEDRKDVKRGKKYYEAAEHILNALIAGSTTLALDFSDLSKPFGGEGMEGMAMGWDPDRARSAT